jgi:hypothetical protein
MFTMLDLRGQTPRRNVTSNYATFTDFTVPNNTSSWTRIDFVFGGSNLGWWVFLMLNMSFDAHTDCACERRTAGRYKVGTSLADDGVLASDHRPVFTDVSI